MRRNRPDTDDTEVVDLMPYAEPCRVVVAFVDAYDSTRTVDTRPMDEALLTLDALPRLPGRIGDALQLITRASGRVEPDRFQDAINELRRIAGLAHHTPDVPASPARPGRDPWRRRHRPSTVQQEQLWPETRT